VYLRPLVLVALVAGACNLDDSGTMLAPGGLRGGSRLGAAQVAGDRDDEDDDARNSRPTPFDRVAAVLVGAGGGPRSRRRTAAVRRRISRITGPKAISAALMGWPPIIN